MDFIVREGFADHYKEASDDLASVTTGLVLFNELDQLETEILDLGPQSAMDTRSELYRRYHLDHERFAHALQDIQELISHADALGTYSSTCARLEAENKEFSAATEKWGLAGQTPGYESQEVAQLLEPVRHLDGDMIKNIQSLQSCIVPFANAARAQADLQNRHAKLWTDIVFGLGWAIGFLGQFSGESALKSDP